MVLSKHSHTILAVALICVLNNCNRDNKQEIAQNPNTKAPMAFITLPSGLKYEVLHHGSEKTPNPGQKVTVHYTGWLDEGNGVPGKKFDSSVDRKQPFTFHVGKGLVIKGWDEMVLSMAIGEKRRVIIPPSLAYGARGYPPDIPANATLIFDIELLSID